MERDCATPPPTDAELVILRALWHTGPATVREVHAALSDTKSVGYTTVLKQMQVMHSKGLLKRSERFRAHVYQPRTSRGQTQTQLARALLRGAFNGSARALLQSALAGRTVDPLELAEIRELLDNLERGA